MANYFDKYKNVKYNDIRLEDFCHIQDISEPLLTSRTINTLDIRSVDGGRFNGSKKNSYKITITVLIDCDTQEEYDDSLEQLKNTFDVNEPKAFYKDEDKFIMAITDEEIEPQEKVLPYSREFKISLFCPSPYYYSSDIKVFENKDDDINTVIADNEGKNPVCPIINIGFSKDTHFAQVELSSTGEKILVGKYPQLELSSTTKSNRVLADNCETTSNWINSSASIDSDRTTGGTLAMNSDVMIGTVPNGDTTWKGVCVRQNLTKAVDEFKLSCYMHHKSNGVNGDPTKPKYKNEQETVISGSKTTYYKVTCSSLNVRSGAGTSYKKIGTLAKGYKIKNGTLSNGWVKFTYNNKTGYCSSKYLTKIVEDNTVTQTECNFVIITDSKSENVSAYLRESAQKSSKALTKIPTGTKVRCIIKEYKDTASGLVYYKLSKKYNGYMGYIATGNLVKAENAIFEYDASEAEDTADDKMGIVELYGFDANGSQLFCLGMYDDNAWYEYTYPKCRIGSKTVLKDTTTVPKPKTGTVISKDDSGNATVTVSNKLSGRLGDWNRFYGKWIITREKVNNQYVWTVEVQKIKDGVTLKTQKTTNIKYNDLPTGALSYVVLYIGVNDTTLDKASAMDFTDIKVDELNPKEETVNKNVTYFKEGDILEIDCENHRCYLNDESCDDLVDIGSRYFELPTGEQEIKIYSDDSETSTSLVMREKY